MSNIVNGVMLMERIHIIIWKKDKAN